MPKRRELTTYDRLVNRRDYRGLIIYLVKNAPTGGMTKTNILKKIFSEYFPGGYVTRQTFPSAAKAVDRDTKGAFTELVAERKIRYTPRKPVRMPYENAADGYRSDGTKRSDYPESVRR